MNRTAPRVRLLRNDEATDRDDSPTESSHRPTSGIVIPQSSHYAMDRSEVDRIQFAQLCFPDEAG